MNHGEVSCYGTSLYLKRLYGTGYHLNISMKETAPVPPITRVIEQYVTTATMTQSSPSQLTYNIKSEESSQFPALFSALDGWRTELGVTSMSINSTTLEDVFLKVAEEPNNFMETNGEVEDEVIVHKYKKISGCGLIVHQVKAMVYKRFLTKLRSWISTIIYIVIPVLLMAYSVNRSMKQDYSPDQPNLSINLTSFPGVHVAVSSDDQSSTSLMQHLVASGGATYESIPANVDFNDYFGKQINSSLILYERKMIAGFKFNSGKCFGGKSRYFTHSMPLVLNLMANVLLQTVSPSSSIMIDNHPLSVQTAQDICDISLLAASHVFLFPMVMTFLSLALMILAMTFISFPLRERVSNAKQLQLMTGVSPIIYWLTTLLCDFIFYLITAALMISTVFIFQENNLYSKSGCIGTLVEVFLLAGVSGLAYAYFFSFLVKSSIKASLIFIIVNLITGTVAAVFLTLLGSFYTDYDFYIYLFSFNPLFSSTSAFIHLFSAMYVNGACLQCGVNCKTQDPLQFLETGMNSVNPNGIYNFLIFLAVDTVLFFGLVLMIEYGLAKKLWFHVSKMWIKMNNDIMEEDSDVLIEREKVKSSQSLRGYVSNTSVLRVSDLGKKYNRKMTAVHGVTFQVGRGECFGLLGVNGAGKTTIFKMLTGEEIPNKGDANILQCSLHNHKSKFLSKIGYCPQFDAINKLLTGKEMLYVYALLRGIPSTHCDAEVSRWVRIMGLTEYADRPCGTYSGGNKRKLSTAMAFIGEPPVVFLDEPTSGVDPVSRRKLWDVMARCQFAGQAIVLTSHSMEECEALCSRLTIMVAGYMKCIGSGQYLKQKFGQGYTVKIKLHSPNNVVQNAIWTLKYDVSNEFGNCSIKDEHLGLLHYHVLDPSIRLSELFTKMEHLKRRHDIIEDYLVSDTTLEQVFMSFARDNISTDL